MTVLSTAISGTVKYPCNGNSGMSQEEGASMHRQLKQKLTGSAKPEGL